MSGFGIAHLYAGVHEEAESLSENAVEQGAVEEFKLGFHESVRASIRR